MGAKQINNNKGITMKKMNFLAVLLGGLLSAQTTFTLVKDIYPGTQNAFPSNFTLYKGKMVFAAGSSIGNELWESDGTEEGTKLVADILPGASSSSPSNLFTFSNKIYFTGARSINGANVYGVLMSYDEVNGVQTISTSANFAANFTGLGNTLYFKATNTAVNPNTQRLFYLDDAGQPTIADNNLNVSVIGYAPGKVIANAQLATATNVYWTQLFGFDGTTVNLVKNINPTSSSYPQNFYYSSALGKTIFNANGGNGTEPWITDGTEQGTYLIKDINTSNSTAGSAPSNFTEFNGKIYFSASNGLENGPELWVTDGTAEGTKMLKDIATGSTGSSPERMVVFKDKLYFLATNTGNVRQLWETDGTENGTKIVASLASASSLVVYNNQLYLSGRITNNDEVGAELYKVNLPDANLSAATSHAPEIKVFPNPSNGEFYLSNLKSGTFELFDLTGKLVKQGNFSGGKVAATVQPGYYILKVKTSATTVMIEKIKIQ